MAITTFIPKLWASRLEYALDKAHVATQFVNRNYEGEIKNQGDTVHINFIGAITIDDYTKNADMNDPEELATTQKNLVISQSKYFNFQVDDVDRVQAAGELIDTAMGRAAYGLSDASDAYLFGVMSAGAGSTVTKTTNAYADAVEMQMALNKANVPMTGRKMAVTPEYYAELLKDSHFVEASDAAHAIVTNGVVGYVAGMEVYISNNLSGVSALATVNTSTTYAEQIASVEAYRMEKRFADGVKGLHLYGALVTDGTQIVVRSL